MASDYFREGSWWYRDLAEGEEPGRWEHVYTYTWKHVPTGKEGTKRVACTAREDFEGCLESWNARVHGDWVYSEVPSPS